jgi:DNA-binding CsgD family transcriptional regulator
MVATRSPGTPSRPTSILVDESGAVIDAPGSAWRWLEEMRRSETLDTVGMLLASLAARVRFMRSVGDTDRHLLVRMRSHGGSWTTLIAEPMSQGPHQSRIPVVVMATDAGQLLPLQVAAFGLREREADVVGHVLHGLDTKSIASRMSISVLTVQDHLKAIFDKTGVHSRRELVYLLGRDASEGT